ncbi:MAG: WYL domain-containing protein [Rhodobacter sp.]|nr:WYL domain-containing protein [Rhodobacter sp.]
MGGISHDQDHEMDEAAGPRFQPAIRLLKVALSLAASAKGRSVTELMHEFGLGKRTAQRMVATLDDLFPVERIDEGRYRRYRIRAGLSAFLLAPTSEELASLELAAQAFDEQGDTARAVSLRDLGRRNLAALRGRRRIRSAPPEVEALTSAQLPVAAPGPHVAIDPEILSTCQTALLVQRLLSFNYASTSGKSTKRVVAARGLLIGTRSYLVAASQEDDDPVLFRLDRMSGVEITASAAWHDPEFDLESYRARSVGVHQERMFDTRLIFDADVSDSAKSFRFHPLQETSLLDDGRLVVEFTSGGLRELAWHLMTWGPKVTIDSPQSLKSEMFTLLKDLLARHKQENGAP